MSKKEYKRFLEENKKQVKFASDQFDKHIKAIDQKIREILLHL